MPHLSDTCLGLMSAVYFVSLAFLLGLSSSFISLSASTSYLRSEVLFRTTQCVTMVYVKQRISSTTVKVLECLLLPRNFKKKASRRGIHKFITLYSSSGRICRRPGSKITAEIRSIVDLQMTTTVSNTRLAAFLQLTKHVFGINGFLRRSSV